MVKAQVFGSLVAVPIIVVVVLWPGLPLGVPAGQMTQIATLPPQEAWFATVPLVTEHSALPAWDAQGRRDVSIVHCTGVAVTGPLKTSCGAVTSFLQVCTHAFPHLLAVAGVVDVARHSCTQALWQLLSTD